MNKPKAIKYDFNTNTIHAVMPSGTQIELGNVLTKAQIKKFNRSVARRFFAVNGKNGMSVK